MFNGECLHNKSTNFVLNVINYGKYGQSEKRGKATHTITTILYNDSSIIRITVISCFSKHMRKMCMTVE